MGDNTTIQALTRSVMAIVMFVTASNVFVKESKGSMYPTDSIVTTMVPEQKKTQQNSFDNFKHVVDILPTVVVENLTMKTVKQLNCLALNNYYEAATEGIKGMQAVSQVVMNRMSESGFPGTPCDVIYQKKQFSWTFQRYRQKLDTNSNQWRQAVHVAKQMYLDNHRVKGLEDALFYHADYVNPRWNKVVKLQKIGTHIFYGRA